jgi:hypothetical protein
MTQFSAPYSVDAAWRSVIFNLRRSPMWDWRTLSGPYRSTEISEIAPPCPGFVRLPGCSDYRLLRK